jgi:hypothetical protein
MGYGARWMKLRFQVVDLTKLRRLQQSQEEREGMECKGTVPSIWCLLGLAETRAEKDMNARGLWTRSPGRW